MGLEENLLYITLFASLHKLIHLGASKLPEVNMPSTVATGDFGPAPPNIDLSDNQNAKLSAPVAIVAICGTIAVLLRFFIRIRAKDVRLALDDYLVGLALVSDHIPHSPQQNCDKYFLEILTPIVVFLLGDRDIMLFE